MTKRVINGRINYIKGIQSNRNKLLETIVWTIETEQETKWIKTTRKYMKVTNINFNDIRLNSKEYLKWCSTTRRAGPEGGRGVE